MRRSNAPVSHSLRSGTRTASPGRLCGGAAESGDPPRNRSAAGLAERARHCPGHCAPSAVSQRAGSGRTKPGTRRTPCAVRCRAGRERPGADTGHQAPRAAARWMNPNDPNVALVEIVAERLGEALCSEVVFVGGAIAGLLITDPAQPGIRPTQDVDLLCDVAALSEYHRIETATIWKTWWQSSTDAANSRTNATRARQSSAPTLRISSPRCSAHPPSWTRCGGIFRVTKRASDDSLA